MSLVNAKIVNAFTKAEADSKADTGQVLSPSSIYKQFELKLDVGGAAGDTFTLIEDGVSFVQYPEFYYDDKGEVFARVDSTVLSPLKVEDNAFEYMKIERKFTLLKDVEHFEMNFAYMNYSEFLVMSNPQDYTFYPHESNIDLTIGDESYSTMGSNIVIKRYDGLIEQLRYQYNNGVITVNSNNWLSEMSEGDAGLGIPETLVTLTIPDDVPLSFKDAAGADPYDGVIVREFFEEGGDSILVGIDRVTSPESLITLVSATDKERVYRIAEKASGSNPYAYHINPTLVATDTSFVTADMTKEDLLKLFPNYAQTIKATTDDESMLASSGLTTRYDKSIGDIYAYVTLVGSEAEVKKINIVEKDNNGVYQYLQVKDVDTGELVPVSEYEIKDSILPQIPGTQLVSKDIFTRLGGGYEVATPYTEVQDPMTTVLVKRVLFNTVLNAVLEDGTVIKQ